MSTRCGAAGASCECGIGEGRCPATVLDHVCGRVVSTLVYVVYTLYVSSRPRFYVGAYVGMCGVGRLC